MGLSGQSQARSEALKLRMSESSHSSQGGEAAQPQPESETAAVATRAFKDEGRSELDLEVAAYLAKEKSRISEERNTELKRVRSCPQGRGS